jgi:hypothetical protein
LLYQLIQPFGSVRRTIAGVAVECDGFVRTDCERTDAFGVLHDGNRIKCAKTDSLERGREVRPHARRIFATRRFARAQCLVVRYVLFGNRDARHIAEQTFVRDQAKEAGNRRRFDVVQRFRIRRRFPTAGERFDLDRPVRESSFTSRFLRSADATP